MNPSDSLFDVAAEMQAFPQGQFYKQANIDRWLEAIRSFDAGRERWHLKRLTGIGGSEIGVLTGDLEGLFHPHQSALEICRSKLLQHFPEPPTGDMLRGQIMEPIARDRYREQILKQYPLAKPREDIMEALSDFRHPDHPWMVGNPDEIMELEPGKLFVVDYKCPTQISFADIQRYGPPFYYVAQLHHYLILAEAKGYKIEGLQLASLDYKSFNVLVQDVRVDPEQIKKNIYAGDFFWNEHIMKNSLPTSTLARRFGDRGDLPDNLHEDAVNYTLLRHIGNHAIRRSDAIGDKTRESTLGLDAGVDQVSIGLTTIKTKRELDLEGLSQAILKVAPGLDTSVFHKDPELDAEALLRRTLERRGLTLFPADDERWKKQRAELAKDPAMSDLLAPPELSQPFLARQARQLSVDLTPHIITEEISFALAKPSKKDAYVTHMDSQIREVAEQGVDALMDSMRDQLIDIEQNFQTNQIKAPAKRRGARP